MPPQFRSPFLLGALLAVFLSSRTAFLLWEPWCLVTLLFLESGTCVVCPSPISSSLSVLATSSFLPTMPLLSFVLLFSRLSYLSRVVSPEILLPAAEWFDSLGALSPSGFVTPLSLLTCRCASRFLFVLVALVCVLSFVCPLLLLFVRLSLLLLTSFSSTALLPC